MKGKKQVTSLSNSEYNTHKLPDGHHYDYTEFRSAEKFDSESKPNQRVIQKMKNLHTKTKSSGGKIIINTARADFDDRDRFLGAFKKHGVDIDNIHVHRAGNMKGEGTVASKKTEIIRNQIKNGNYNHVSLYDDSEQNLKHFLELKKEFPHINFNAHHVKPDGKFKRYTG
jgi:Mg2+/Co2+ transporter CorB